MCNEQTNPGKKLCARFLRNRQANLKHNSAQNSNQLKKRFVRKNDKESRRKNSARNSCVTNKQSREKIVHETLALQTNNPENRQCARLSRNKQTIQRTDSARGKRFVRKNDKESRRKNSARNSYVTNKQSREQTVHETLGEQTVRKTLA